jgi:DUF2934 family protein
VPPRIGFYMESFRGLVRAELSLNKQRSRVMAKRKSRSQAKDPSTPADQSMSTASDAASPSQETAASRESQTGATALDANTEARSTSMGSEPSEEDVRMRAYQRYLDRGGDHGADFDDWVNAERELQRKRERFGN